MAVPGILVGISNANHYRPSVGAPETFSTVLAGAGAGLPADVVLAGSGNVGPVGLNGIPATVTNRTVRQLFGTDVSPASLERVTFRGASLGVPYLANPRAYFWKQGQLPASIDGRLPMTWEDAISVPRRQFQVIDRLNAGHSPSPASTTSS